MRTPIVLQAPIQPIYDGWLSTFWKPAERVIHVSTGRTFGLGGLAGQKLHIRRLVVPGVVDRMSWAAARWRLCGGHTNP